MENMIKDLKSKIATLIKSCNGVAAVEFALIAPVLMIVVFGVYDYGQAMLKKTELRSATRAGAQYAIKDSTDSTAISSVVNDASNLTISTVTVLCNCMDVNTGAITSTDTCEVLACTPPDAKLANVAATYAYDFMFGTTTLNISADTTVRIQ